MDLFDKQVCRICGCTDDCACPEGCYWVDDDLCSSCAEKFRWISVENELPEEYELVLLYISERDEMVTGYWEDSQDSKNLEWSSDWWSHDHDFISSFGNEEVTHWMQLPQSPEEK